MCGFIFCENMQKNVLMILKIYIYLKLMLFDLRESNFLILKAIKNQGEISCNMHAAFIALMIPIFNINIVQYVQFIFFIYIFR
jgi:hypothetical protein